MTAQQYVVHELVMAAREILDARCKCSGSEKGCPYNRLRLAIEFADEFADTEIQEEEK